MSLETARADTEPAVVMPATPHSGNSAARWASVLLQSLLLPLLGAVLVLGWRAAVAVALFMACYAVARAAWRRIAVFTPRSPQRGGSLHWAAPVLVACALPAEAAAWSFNVDGRTVPIWPIIPGAALLLAALQALKRRVRWPRFEPVVLTLIVIHLILGSSLRPQAIVQRSHAIVGDVLSARESIVPIEPWRSGDRNPTVTRVGAVRVPCVSWALSDYLRGITPENPTSAALTIERLLREGLPPLDDVVALGVPAPIGMTSVALLMAAILLASFRGTFDARIPIVAVLLCYATLVVFPWPVSVENGHGEFRWLAPFVRGIGVDTGLTFVHYLLLGTPALFCFGMLANLAEVRPLHRRARFAWAALLGICVALSLLYLSPVWGPYVAVLVCGAVSPIFDRFLRPRALRI